jgi:hypothetical protein
MSSSAVLARHSESHDEQQTTANGIADQAAQKGIRSGKGRDDRRSDALGSDTPAALEDK